MNNQTKIDTQAMSEDDRQFFDAAMIASLPAVDECQSDGSRENLTFCAALQAQAALIERNKIVKP